MGMIICQLFLDKSNMMSHKGCSIHFIYWTRPLIQSTVWKSLRITSLWIKRRLTIEHFLPLWSEWHLCISEFEWQLHQNIAKWPQQQPIRQQHFPSFGVIDSRPTVHNLLRSRGVTVLFTHLIPNFSQTWEYPIHLPLVTLWNGQSLFFEILGEK